MGLESNSLRYQLLKWRDDQARLEDESLEFTLPNALLERIARAAPGVFTTEDVVKLAKEWGYVPDLVESNLEQLL